LNDTEHEFTNLRRSVFGLLALMCLAVGIYFSGIGSGGSPADTDMFVYGISMRIGMVLGAIWLAYPELSRIPRWMYVILLIAATAVMIQPKLILVIAPIVIAIWVFRPRAKPA